jgi:organic radical activating enzyme
LYIQITRRCNFKCAHCVFCCTEKGKDMKWEVFKAAVKTANKNKVNTLNLGGGEPTIHPEFEKFLDYAVKHSKAPIWVTTNGSQTSISLKLAKLAERGEVGVSLSADQWHKPISPRVIKAFEKESDAACDLREIRKKFKNDDALIDGGRASRKSFKHKKVKYCYCDTIFVTPDGVIKQCGCPRSPVIGNVFRGFKPFGGYYGYWTRCYKDIRIESDLLRGLNPELLHSTRKTYSYSMNAF